MPPLGLDPPLALLGEAAPPVILTLPPPPPLPVSDGAVVAAMIVPLLAVIGQTQGLPLGCWHVHG